MKKTLLFVLILALMLSSVLLSAFAVNEITVTVTIRVEQDYWLSKYPVTVNDENPTVYHAFVKACADNNISHEGASDGYIASMSNGDTEIGEFISGPESGWLYMVNGKTPDVGLTDYLISNGDFIEWYFSKYDFSDNTADELNLNEIIADTAECLMREVPQPAVSQVGGEWLMLGLARSGVSVPPEYIDKYKDAVFSYTAEKQGVLHTRKYTEYARTVLALSAIGNDPRNFGGYNLLAPLADYENVIRQGTNGAAFSLIALDCKNYEMPVCSTAKTQATRQMYIDFILNSQNGDGGFALTKGSLSDADVTAMALQALSRYTDENEVMSSINSALSYLSQIQNDDGGFTSQYSESSETTSQVLSALSMLNIPVYDERFIKNDVTVLDSLLSFYIKGKGFSHQRGANEVDLMATEQALCALVSYKRMCDSNTSIYDMSDVTDATLNDAVTDFGLVGKDEHITFMPIITPEKTFDDISDNLYKTKIEALASRGIINGKTNSLYDPDSTMTRAEFAAIVTRALGLTSAPSKIFDDVTDDKWYYNYVATAFEFGIVNGVSETLFNPDGTITREDASVMISRCARLCGTSTDTTIEQVRNILAQFDDYTDLSGYATASVAYCVKSGILYDDTLEINPKEFVKRDEIAHMVYSLLKISNLL